MLISLFINYNFYSDYQVALIFLAFSSARILVYMGCKCKEMNCNETGIISIELKINPRNGLYGKVVPHHLHDAVIFVEEEINLSLVSKHSFAQNLLLYSRQRAGDAIEPAVLLIVQNQGISRVVLTLEALHYTRMHVEGGILQQLYTSYSNVIAL